MSTYLATPDRSVNRLSPKTYDSVKSAQNESNHWQIRGETVVGSAGVYVTVSHPAREQGHGGGFG